MSSGSGPRFSPSLIHQSDKRQAENHMRRDNATY